MAAPAVPTTDVASALADLLVGVEGVRVYPYVADKTRPPAVIIGQPELDFEDSSGGYCRAVWMFPLTLVSIRANDRDAQNDLGRMLLDVSDALQADITPGLFSVEPVNARPIPVTVNGQELPGYLMNVRVRA